MPREFSRSQRVSEQIRRDLAEIVRAELKDPRIGLCSFTEVKLSRDISHAVVYCSVLDENAQQETIDILNRASGFLRSKVASRLIARTVPALRFVLDDSGIRGAAMDNLIGKALRSDSEREQHTEQQPSTEQDETDDDDVTPD
jgi:ribosome-binding factor A